MCATYIYANNVQYTFMSVAYVYLLHLYNGNSLGLTFHEWQINKDDCGTIWCTSTIYMLIGASLSEPHTS